MQEHFNKIYGAKKTDLLLNLHIIDQLERNRGLMTDTYVALLQKLVICVNETAKNGIENL